MNDINLMDYIAKQKEKFDFINTNIVNNDYINKKIKEKKSLTKNIVIGKGMLYTTEPYQREINGFKSGKVLKKIPKNSKDVNLYHFDENDNIIMIYKYGQSENIINIDFIDYIDDFYDVISISNSDNLRNIQTFFIKNKMIIKDINWGKYGCSLSIYSYNENGVLINIKTEQKEHSSDNFSYFNIVFEYVDNVLNKITKVFPNGYKEVCYT